MSLPNQTQRVPNPNPTVPLPPTHPTKTQKGKMRIVRENIEKGETLSREGERERREATRLLVLPKSEKEGREEEGREKVGSGKAATQK